VGSFRKKVSLTREHGDGHARLNVAGYVTEVRPTKQFTASNADSPAAAPARPYGVAAGVPVDLGRDCGFGRPLSRNEESCRERRDLGYPTNWMAALMTSLPWPILHPDQPVAELPTAVSPSLFSMAKEKDTRAAMLFGRAFELALAAYFRREDPEDVKNHAQPSQPTQPLPLEDLADCDSIRTGACWQSGRAINAREQFWGLVSAMATVFHMGRSRAVLPSHNKRSGFLLPSEPRTSSIIAPSERISPVVVTISFFAVGTLVWTLFFTSSPRTRVQSRTDLYFCAAQTHRRLCGSSV